MDLFSLSKDIIGDGTTINLILVVLHTKLLSRSFSMRCADGHERGHYKSRGCETGEAFQGALTANVGIQVNCTFGKRNVD